MRGAKLAIGMVLGAAMMARAEEKPPAIKLERVVKGLQHLTYLASDGTNRLFVVEQEGTIRLMVDGKVHEGAYLDIADHVQYGGECGLRSGGFRSEVPGSGGLYRNYPRKKPQVQQAPSGFLVEPPGGGGDRQAAGGRRGTDEPVSR